MFGPSLSVGVISASLKAIVILFVTLVGEAAAFTIKQMFKFRLGKYGNSPLIFESDGKLFSIRDTMRRLWGAPYSGALVMALLCVAVFPTEMMSDFGVDVSDKCKPQRLATIGICPTKMIVRTSWDKALLTSFQVEDAPWDNEMLVASPIRQGFRKHFEGDEYFGDEVERNTSLPVVIDNCTVSEPKTLPVVGTTLHFSSAPASRSDGIRFMKIVAQNGSSFSGKGMLTNNNVFHSAFLVMKQEAHVNRSTLITLFEYPYSDHMAEVEQEMTAENASETLSTRARLPVISYNISCRTAAILPNVFVDAIYGYRFAQLARSGKRKLFSTVKFIAESRTFEIPKPISTSDIVRGLLASKISEVISCAGETFVYTSCGWYDFSYGGPLAVVGGIIIFTALLFKARGCRAPKGASYPVSSKTWSMFALQKLELEETYIHMDSEEYRKEYMKYGKRGEMGEYCVSGGDGSEFRVRRIKFGGVDK